MTTNANENSETFLNAGQVRARYGGASHMWLLRRMADSEFPKPTYLGRLRFWRLSELVLWERDQAGKKQKPPASQFKPKTKPKNRKRRAA
jgi:predicted DNA-binding transcriptional regulator AlpA